MTTAKKECGINRRKWNERGDKMNDARFVVRETKAELKKLDRALSVMGYSSRADWYREKKREIIREAEKKEVKNHV